MVGFSLYIRHLSPLHQHPYANQLLAELVYPPSKCEVADVQGWTGSSRLDHPVNADGQTGGCSIEYCNASRWDWVVGNAIASVA